jgi:hypothetical protein
MKAVMLTLATLLLAVAAHAGPLDWQGFGNLEMRVDKPFIPATLDVAGGVSLQITTLPEKCPLLGYRSLWLDAKASTLASGSAFLGASLSLQRVDADDTLRLGVKIVGPDAGKVWYLSKGFPFTW